MGKWRILVVDDENEVLEVIQQTLAPRYEVVVCASGGQALDQMDIIQPDMIVLDVIMPDDLDGYEVCRRLRASREHAQTPILFLSALDGVEDMKKAYALGANLYLTKPFDPLRLMKNIDVFIERTPPPFRHKSVTLEDAIAQVAGYTAPPAGSNPPSPTAAASADPPSPGSGAASSGDRPSGASSAALPRALFVLEDAQRLGRLAGPCEDRLEFVWALDGREALDRLAIFEPDVVALEESLPGMDGLALTRAIREDALFHDTPIVFLSLQDSPSERDGARRAGATECLQLTDDHDAIIDAVARQMAGRPPRRKKISIQEALDILEFGMDGGGAPEDDEI